MYTLAYMPIRRKLIILQRSLLIFMPTTWHLPRHLNVWTPTVLVAYLLVMVDVRSVEEEDLELDDAARVVVAALEVAELVLELAVLDALIDVESVPLCVPVVDACDADVVEPADPDVDELTEPGEPAVAVAQ